MARHIRKGDMVFVISGDGSKRRLPDGQKVADRTPRQVLRVLPDTQQVIVEGINVVRKAVKPNQKQPQGGFVEKNLPIHWSNVQPAVDNKPSRVGFETREDGSKVRVARVNGQQIGPALKQPRSS